MRESCLGEVRQVLLNDSGLAVALKLSRWSDAEERLTLGDQVEARVRAIQPDLGGAFLETQSKANAFLRLPPDHGITEGAQLSVIVVSEARSDKLARVALGREAAPYPYASEWREASIEDVPPGDVRVDAAFDEILSTSIVIPTGGRLEIEPTRALVAVDIDTAGRRGKGSAASRALQINKDACAELVRQIYLRKLGGLIILDCVAPLNAESTRKIQKFARTCFEQRGEQTATVLAPSRLGLMEMSLPWRETPLSERILNANGDMSDESLCLQGLRQLERTATHQPMDRLVLELPARAMDWFERRGAPLKVNLKNRYGARLAFAASTRRSPIVYQVP